MGVRGGLEIDGVTVEVGMLVFSDGANAGLLVLSPKTLPDGELLLNFAGSIKRVKKSNRLLGGEGSFTVLVPNTTGETMLVTFGFSEIE